MSTTLSQTKNRAFGYFKFRTKRNLTVWVLLMFLNLFGIPFAYFMEMILYVPTTAPDRIESYKDLFDVIPIISFFCLAMAVFIGFLAVYAVFDYLHNKTMGDMIYSTPLSRNKRFISDYSSGLFIYLVPFIFGSVTGGIMAAIANSKIPVSDQFLPSCSQLWTGIFGLFIAMIMAYAMAVFVLMCCGSILESVVYSFVSLLIVPAVIFSTIACGFGNLYGINTDSILWNFVCPTSPFGVLAGTIFTIEGSSSGISSGLSNYENDNLIFHNYIFSAKFLIPALLIIVALTLGAFLLNNKRKVEKGGTPFVFKGLYYFIITGIVYCAYTCSYNANGNNSIMFAVAIIIGIVYLILEIVTNRGFKGLWKGVVRYAVTSVLATLCAVGLVKADGFKMWEKVPDLSEVESVSISNYYTSIGFTSVTGIGPMSFKVTEEEYIKCIIDFQTNQIEDYKNNKEELSGTMNTTLHLTYNLKNGKTISRAYYHSLYKNEMILRKIEFSEGYKNAQCYKIDQLLSNPVDVSISGSNQWLNEYSLDITSRINNNKLAEVLKKDIMSYDEEIYFDDDNISVCNMLISSYYNGLTIGIKSCYKNTIDYLNECGCKDYLNGLSGETVKSLEKYKAIIISPEMSYTIQNMETNEKQTVNDLIYSHVGGIYFWWNDISYDYDKYGLITDLIRTDYDFSCVKQVETTREDFIELFKHMQQDYISDEPCYAVKFISNDPETGDLALTYIVPEKYSEMAKKIFDSGEDYIPESNFYYD